MEKKYIVVGFGTNKETGERYCRAALVREGKDWGYVDLKNTYYPEEIRPVGTIIPVTLIEG